MWKKVIFETLLTLVLCYPLTARSSDEPAVGDGEDEDEDEDEDEEIEEIEDVEDVEVVQQVDASATGGAPLAFDGLNAVQRDRGFNVLTARPNRKGALTLIIDHRPRETFWNGKDAFFNYLGLDSGGLKIGLGMRYGILDDLDAGFYRLNDGGLDRFDTYEFDARFRFLKQARHGVDASVRAGVSWFVQPDHGDASGFLGQLFANRIFFDSLLVGVGFAFHSESSNDEKSTVDDAYSGAITGVVEWRIIRSLAWTGEISAAVLGYHSTYPAWSTGLKVLTARHTFSLLVSNTQYINADGIVANSRRKFDDLIFGFQILREFDF